MIRSLILKGIELAKNMELDLSNILANDPLILSQKCDEIIDEFSKAKQQLICSLTLEQHHHQQQPLYQPDMGVVFGYVQRQLAKGKGKQVAGDVVGVAMKAESGGDEQGVQHGYGTMMEVGGSSTSSVLKSSTPRRSSSRNYDQGSNQRVRMAAPRIGNTEMPPEDGFTWRKYGQKEIINAKYPRSYYRCTHQKLYNCKAKKQVQRLDDDPYTFDILYREEHTCHMSNTAPSSVPPPQSPTVHDIFLPHHQPITTVAPPFHHWLPMDLPRLSNEGACNVFDPQQQQQEQLYRASSVDGEPSTVRSHHGGDQAVDLLNNQSMVDCWSEMFNSGSSSSTSMEVIFAPTDDKWENKDRKD
ncbi:WRKY transcription factor 55-like [Chenopodium quinoa]|uniref:WRKY transcription factor 55-like n=1 Tax=Chenopodium quinoa TaxID=63459 RepID=UPI000B77288C|nr:WRKY transcription factor 55-like [Chenopodium quinoa]